ncbi:Imm49 family immunity protein [Kitasatospora sp. NPDC091335]|uniref:Imm49 family immunity protein n=1 Tax=Kitasatospora sp. NPDC091335 TaxID=3364085 RepID=UPI003806079D
MTATEWQLISDAFLDQLGALSLTSPQLSSPEAQALLRNAAEAAAGVVSFSAYYPRDRFSVFLDYVNFGMEYDREAAPTPARLGVHRWVNAFCLIVLADAFDRHAEALIFTWQALAPASDLATALLSHFPTCIDFPTNTGDDPTFQALHALTTADRPAFDAAVLALLDRTDGTRPRTLLPLLPLALSALAHRAHGWLPSVETDYLPHSLVTGFATPERRPEDVAWPVRLDRPTPPLPLDANSEALFERSALEATTASARARALEKQATLFCIRASHAPDATDAQLAGLRRGSQLGADLFRDALADSDATTAASPGH